MPSASTLASRWAIPVREFFTLRRAEQLVRDRPPAQRERIHRLVQAAGARLSAGRCVPGAVPASLLLKDAVVQLLRAMEAARHPELDDEGLAARPLTMPTLAPDPARPRAEPTDDAWARAAVASSDPLYFDNLCAEDAERTRWALDRAASMLRRHLEARSLARVRATRWGRRAAVGVIVLWGLVTFARAKLSPRDIALGKPVHPSSQKAAPPDGQTLVDGDTGTSVGVHTNVEDSPSVTIDLEAGYWLSIVKVYNRMDGWFDDCLPLVVEVSQDGKAFTELARRDTHFGTSPPWTVDAGGRPGRYVRLRVDKRGYLALSEVEVYGTRQ